MSKKKKEPYVADEIAEDLKENNSAISTDEDNIIEEELPELDPIKALEKDLKETKVELARQKDEFVRLQAETDNFRKRLSREKDEFSQYANERLFKELIPIFDNFERALEATTSDTKSLKEGLDMILTQFSNFLKKEKVEPIKAVGEKFDPAIHEALSSEESDEHKEDTIVRQFVKGYMINNRVLRPTQVVISKKPSTESAKNSDKEEDPTS